MRLFGVIGSNLEHSFSPDYFARKFISENIKNVEYRAFELPSIYQLPALIASQPNLAGLNVTIPYKETVLEFLHEVDDIAQSIGAVNTITIDRSGESPRLVGHNTDAFGFRTTLSEVLKKKSTKALILGTGGASKAIAYSLEQLKIPYAFVSRQPSGSYSMHYEQVTPEIIAQVGLIINTTPLGMFPNIETYPLLPYAAINKKHLLYDLVYNPEETAFLRQGAAGGAKTINGIPMLHAQAEKSWEWWNK